MKKILIVGGVAGGATAAARLRRLDEKSQIIMFERGEYISFANCGLPYYIGNVIENRDALLVQTVEGMKKRFNLDIRNFSEVVSIDAEKMEVTVNNLSTGETYVEKYDELILSPGASPIKPPITGIADADNIFTLRNIPDTDAIKGFVDTKNPKEAVVVGGGFIGIEMAENLAERGVRVHLVEMLNQVMAPIDFEMAQIVHKHMVEKGVDLILGDGVDSFEENGRVVKLKSGRKINSDITILSIGIRPENVLAKSAGLELGD
ncbi:MAG: FAD-dependent oxidoreductase, partial [Peptostreptococcus porci]|nr:FAD-dependent oxidoreductase [Peptostreptococcus porci]